MTFATHSQEIERIYSQFSRLGYRAIAITAANEGEGVSSVLRTLAQRYLLSGHKTLVIDLNFYHPTLMPVLDVTEPNDGKAILATPQLIATDDDQAVMTGIATPKGRSALVKLRRSGVLEEMIAKWHQEYDVVLFDTSPLNRVNANNLPAERVAAACDGALMVVLAGRTTKAQMHDAVDRLQAVDAAIVGSVLNDKYNPPLRDELLREINRLPKMLQWLAKRLSKIVTKHRLLSLDV